MSGSSNDKHEQSHDKQFFDTFMMVLGALVLVAFGIYFGAKAIAARTQEAQALNDPIVQKEVKDRLKPVAQVAIAGADNSVLEEKASSSAAALVDMPGEQLYKQTCYACHATGVLNAPKFGDKALWAPRIAKGMETLYQHALHGFNNMPAKGGNEGVSDKSVMAGVDYMVSHSK